MTDAEHAAVLRRRAGCPRGSSFICDECAAIERAIVLLETSKDRDFNAKR